MPCYLARGHLVTQCPLLEPCTPFLIGTKFDACLQPQLGILHQGPDKGGNIRRDAKSAKPQNLAFSRLYCARLCLNFQQVYSFYPVTSRLLEVLALLYVAPNFSAYSAAGPSAWSQILSKNPKGALTR